MEQYTKKINAAIFISGNGSNMKRIIEESQNGVLKNILNIKTVFSDNQDAKGLKIAKSLNINNFYLKQYYKNREKGEKNIVLKLKEMNVEFIILAGYLRILSPYFIDEYKNKIINIHPADTTLYKGKDGYLWAYQNNLEHSSVTIHLVNELVDSGKILNKYTFDIPKHSSLENIKKIGLKLEHETYSNTIKKYILKEIL